ncbi:hypothetical protein [Methylibium petroleiphilum]|uniref:Uncharacterized protein n=1 Tax=Methylibium petroleiphilum (strain ATCC BAA-1232 / LMG 22953 / PM1) TaxID=420662 RepID=A2SMZ7_METPP|nr:hypothetical protein [Methylibium petroleiphilum]ABM96936.1 hypothetical protein Mpe_B0158 [Methylibium petroleiphilum PM1]
MNQSGNTTETFYVNPTIGAWVLVPADPQHHPLLLQLVGGERELIGRPIDAWDSLADGIERIRRTGAERGLVVTVCGNLHRSPTVLLRAARPKPVEPAPTRVFAGLKGMDAAKWGVSDFYDDNAEALRCAIATGNPFDTGWYSVKKEIQSARVSRARRNGPITIEVSASMDEARDLLDTAFWKAAGGNAYCSSGWDALTKIGLKEDEIDSLFDDLAEGCGIGENNTESDYRSLHWRTGFDGVCRALDALAGDLEAQLESIFRGVVGACEERFKGLKRDRGASCRNCKHFDPAIPESRSHPEDPATCAHPKYHAILSVNKHFPFENGCKFWEVKHRP